MRLMGLGGSHVVFIKSLRLLIRYKDVLDKQKKIFSRKKKKKIRKKIHEIQKLSCVMKCESGYEICRMRNKKFLFVLMKQCAASLSDFL